MIRSVARPAILAGWLAVAYLAFVAETSGSLASMMTAAFWLLVAVHAVEALVLAHRLRRAGQPVRASDLLLTMAFGVFHVGPRLAALPRRRG